MNVEEFRRLHLNDESARQTGITSSQMKDAPRGAVYVWCNRALYYPLDLAEHLGRADLQIVSPSWLEPRNAWRQVTGLVLDHAILDLSSTQNEVYAHMRRRLRGDGDRPQSPENRAR